MERWKWSQLREILDPFGALETRMRKASLHSPLLSRASPDVIDAGHGVDVGLGVEGAGDLARGLGVAPATHVLRGQIVMI